jgi:hypothetical protein
MRREASVLHHVGVDQQNIAWYGIPVVCGPVRHEFSHVVSLILGHCASGTAEVLATTLGIFMRRPGGSFEPVGIGHGSFHPGYAVVHTNHFSTFCVGVDTTCGSILPELAICILVTIREDAEHGCFLDLIIVLDNDYLIKVIYLDTVRAQFPCRTGIYLVGLG